MDTRLCNICHQVKPASAFQTYRIKKNDHLYQRRQCKACLLELNREGNAKRSKEWRANNLERDREQHIKAVATRKALGLFPYAAKAASTQQWRKEHPEAWRAICREYYVRHQQEISEKHRQKREENPEEARQKNREWFANNPDKRREFSRRSRAQRQGSAVVDFTEAQWQEVLLVKGYRCDYCGKKFSTPTRDHVTPLSKQGDHTLWNIVVACHSCNAKKGNRAPLNAVQPLLLTVAPKRKKKSS